MTHGFRKCPPHGGDSGAAECDRIGHVVAMEPQGEKCSFVSSLRFEPMKWGHPYLSRSSLAECMGADCYALEKGMLLCRVVSSVEETNTCFPPSRLGVDAVKDLVTSAILGARTHLNPPEHLS